MKSAVLIYPENNSSSQKELQDPFGRTMDYLRLSLTERCNLRCTYCMPEDGVPLKKKDNILSFEEMDRLVRLFLDLGIKKIRITGGEPFVRKGAYDFIRQINAYDKLQSLNITTNAVLIEEYLEDFKELKLESLNISLDSLNRETFKKITLRDNFDIVFDNIFKAVNTGLPTKINVVVLAGVNDHELNDFVALTKEHPLQVRFIEPMPFNGSTFDNNHFKSEDILAIIKNTYDLDEQKRAKNSTSRMFNIDGHAGSVGIIEGFSRTFCGSCNRLRVTAEGILKTCLYDRVALNFKQLIRDGVKDQELIQAIEDAVSKRAKDGFESEKRANMYNLSMAQIGG